MTVGVMLRHPNAAASAEIAEIGWQEVDDPSATSHVLLWHPAAALCLAEWEPVLKWLAHWEVAVPLRQYTKLAEAYGTEEERTTTAAVIHDLRQPVYDSRVVLLRSCPRALRLIKTWVAEMSDTGDDDLALLRAIWQVKPLLLALPMGWVESC